ncbi:MAG TPA: metallophosphoesterase [Steroidobacteraceae bacterium]|nr:metallophosphoesterase [Steroidobacteraceae bacterium]
MSGVRLIQFTDPHLYGDEAGMLRGVATYPSLVAAIERARARDWPVDGILLTGDLVQDDPGGYALIRRALGDIGRPVYCLPGNHDLPEVMRRELADPFIVCGTVDLGAWRIVLLDSTEPGSAGGRLSEDSLAGLDAALAGAAHQHVLVCLHHHPVPMSSLWLDRVGLANPEDLFRVLDAHRNVRALLWGHVHQSFDGLRRHVRLLGTPSTCTQFLPRSDQFALDRRPPAYRTLELRPDGTVHTEVVWLDPCAAHSRHSVCSAA